jgi:hypothetical protein
MAEHEIERPPGTWFVWLWVTGCLILLAVISHTQAPLVTLDCPHDKQKAQGQTAQNNCAPIDVLLVRSWTDLRRGIGRNVRHYRDDIIALSTLIVAVFTGTLWWVTYGMVRIAKEQRGDTLLAIEAANEANRISKVNLAADQRAWLRPLIKISGPLRYVHKGDLEIEFSILVENVGKSPATKVYIELHLIVRSDGWLEDIPEIQKNYSDWAKWRSGAFTEGIVFPGDKPEHVLRMGIHYSEMEKIATNFRILFVGCIDYEIPFSADHHQTWFSGEVRTRMRPTMLINRRDGDTPADDLILVGILSAIHHAD